jgi:hypothetical protein
LRHNFVTKVKADNLRRIRGYVDFPTIRKLSSPPLTKGFGPTTSICMRGKVAG